jgi:hypothetical protein
MDSSGRKVPLKLRSQSDSALVYEKDNDTPVTVDASEWCRDLCEQIGSTGQSLPVALYNVLEAYSKQYPKGYVREPLSQKSLVELVDWLEELRQEAVDDDEDSWWNRQEAFNSKSVLAELGP